MLATWQKPVRGMQLNKSHPLARGLVGCWVMNEAIGDKVFDLSGNENHGTNNGADWVADGLDFNANYDNITTSACNKLFSSKGTIVLKWNKLVFPGAYYYLFTAGSAFTQISVNISPAGNLAYYVGGIGSTVLDSSLITTGYHGYAVTWDDLTNKKELYHNGLLHSTWSPTWSKNFSSQTFNIGGRPASTGRHAGGIIPNFLIFDRVLSAEEVAWLHREPYAIFKLSSVPLAFPTSVPSGIMPLLIHLYNQMRQ